MVFIKNLDKLIDNKMMFDTFSAFGNILSCNVAQDENGESKGYGFIHFETEECANTAIERVNGMLLKEKKVYVGRFIPRQEREKASNEKFPQSVNLYVKNLDDSFDDERLHRAFSVFGNITSAKVMTEDSRSRGFGFVCFTSPEEAAKAVAGMNGIIVGTKPLYVAFAQRKKDRRQHLTSQYMNRMSNVRMNPQLMGGPMYQTAGGQASGGYFVPAMSQAQRYPHPHHMAPMHANPPWASQQHYSTNVPNGAAGAYYVP